MIDTFIRPGFQAVPLAPITAPAPFPAPLRLPGELPRGAARHILKFTRKVSERKLSHHGVSNRPGRRAYVRQLRLAPV